MKVNGAEKSNETKNVMHHNQGKNLNCHQQANQLAILFKHDLGLELGSNHSAMTLPPQSSCWNRNVMDILIIFIVHVLY